VKDRENKYLKDIKGFKKLKTIKMKTDYVSVIG
jgi:hypothetical protein